MLPWFGLLKGTDAPNTGKYPYWNLPYKDHSRPRSRKLVCRFGLVARFVNTDEPQDRRTALTGAALLWMLRIKLQHPFGRRWDLLSDESAKSDSLCPSVKQSNPTRSPPVRGRNSVTEKHDDIQRLAPTRMAEETMFRRTFAQEKTPPDAGASGGAGTEKRPFVTGTPAKK